MVLLKMCLWGKAWRFQRPSHSQLSFSASCLWIRCELSAAEGHACLFAAMLPTMTVMNSNPVEPSGSHENNFFFKKIALVMVIEKLTKPLGCITNFRSAWLHEIPSQKDKKKKKVVFSNFFFCPLSSELQCVLGTSLFSVTPFQCSVTSCEEWLLDQVREAAKSGRDFPGGCTPPLLPLLALPSPSE